LRRFLACRALPLNTRNQKFVKNSKINTVGIIGGGQLGRMTCFAAQAMGFRTVVFTDQKKSPASFVTNQTILAKYSDKKALKKFADLVDVATFEFENIPFETVNYVASQVSFFPRAEILKITQHRILEKNFLNSIGVKTADYAEISDLPSLQKNLKKFGTNSPVAILKTATMGYDGKGQFVLSRAVDAEKAWSQLVDGPRNKCGVTSGKFVTPHLLRGPELILEKFCPFDSEISVLVARGKKSEIKTYAPLTNIHKNGILDESIYPAKISKALQIKAQAIAKKIVEKSDLVGILAVEFFVIGDELLVNELAPRPHNSGHFSMDAAVTSQFEQLIRAITGLPLGSTEFHSEGRMKNLIGDEVKNLEKFYKNPRAKVHLYGKEKVAAGRKMGHVNLLNS
jgi:5-(carboxyamino)imidazole ribonucleotide synthase